MLRRLRFVGKRRLERPTSSSLTRCANQLRYFPDGMRPFWGQDALLFENRCKFTDFISDDKG